MPFNNPIVGAGQQLIRSRIRSPNFEQNIAGWSINQDGSAQFNDVTLTGGSLVVTSPGQGVFVYAGNPELGNLIVSVASSAGTDDHGNEYPQGLSVDEGVISGSTVSIEPGDQGLFVYANDTVVTSYSTPGAHVFAAPASVTSVQVECWGGGGSGGSSAVPAGDGGGGGGGGEYAADPAVVVTGGSNYNITVGAGSTTSSPGGNSSFIGDAVTVTAHGGSTTNNRNGAAGGTGSTNAIHFDGGAGGSGSATSLAGGGGGSSAGRTEAGDAGFAGAGLDGGFGGTAPPGGGEGGNGGDSGAAGLDGQTPGGGGGGTGNGTGGTSGNGANGLVRITYAGTGRVLAASIAADAGTDQYGNDYPAGVSIFGVAGDAGVLTLQPPDTTGFTWSPARVYGDVHPALVLESPTESAGVTEPRSSIFMSGPSTDLDDNVVVIDTNRLEVFSSGSSGETFATVGGSLDVSGELTANAVVGGNIAGGSVTIVPVANTPTSTTVTGLGLPGGLTYIPQVTGNSASTNFVWATASSPSSDGLTVTLLRSNTTGTVIYWTLIGVP